MRNLQWFSDPFRVVAENSVKHEKHKCECKEIEGPKPEGMDRHKPVRNTLQIAIYFASSPNRSDHCNEANGQCRSAFNLGVVFCHNGCFIEDLWILPRLAGR